MAAGSEEKVLSYHDSLLRNTDLLLLEGTHWLNDKLIGFAFEYFEYETFKRIADKVAFIGAEVTQCIKLSNDSEVGIFIEPLDLPHKDYVFMAVNNNQAQLAAGGTHWSLLVFNRPEGKFSHYDSFGSSNQSPAMALSCKLHPFLKVAGDLTLVAEECPQQENGYDCGLYVICITEQLCQHVMGDRVESLHAKITKTTIGNKRNELKSLIVALAKSSTS